MTDTYEYDAFGNAVNKTGATPNNYLYRGEQYDPDLGLYYLRARYYNPATGRFLSVDPLADEGQRRYEYAAADPVDGIDPNGSEAYIEYALLPHILPAGVDTQLVRAFWNQPDGSLSALQTSAMPLQESFQCGSLCADANYRNQWKHLPDSR